MDSPLVVMCIEAATENTAAVEKWRRQRRTLERMPSQLAEPLLHRLIRRRVLFPSLLECFKYSVEEIDLRGESSVDAEWMAYLGGFRYLSSLILADCHKINNSALWSITGMASLKELDISRCSKITDASIKHLLSIPSLEKLYISETGVTAQGVALLGSLSNLTMLDLGGLPVTDSALSSLQVLTRLKHLDLWGCAVSNDGVIHLKMFPSLSYLNLAWTDVTIFPNFPSLACLDMSNCTIISLFEGEGHKALLEKLILFGATITNTSEVFQFVKTDRLCFLDVSNSYLDAFDFLSSMKVTSHLNLSNCLLVDSLVEKIAGFGANLRYLNLCNTRISNHGLATLAGLVPNLETILMAGTLVDDAAILYMSMMPALKTIDLSRTNVKGLIHQAGDVNEYAMSLSTLQNLSHLERLELDEVQVKDAAMPPLTSMKKLRHLTLRSHYLTDAFLSIASCIVTLIHLGVRDALLTNDGLDLFSPPPTLKVLDLRGCWLLTKDCISTFCQNWPLLEVRHEFVTKPGTGNYLYASPPQETIRKPQKLSTPPLHSNNFLDQRLKYNRDKLLSMQFTPPSDQASRNSTP